MLKTITTAVIIFSASLVALPPLHSSGLHKATSTNASSKLYIAVSEKKPDGTFKDAALESDYQAYVARKKKDNKTPRTRDDWEVVRNYWLNDSPMARGNAFNTKRKPFYTCNEVNLVDQKRLDSYIPDKEIVSRKATDFDDISETTFRQYVSEIKNKYAVGKVVRSNTCAQADGKPLKGTYFLEVPDTNKSATSNASFSSIAASYGVTIRYAPE